jgi:hypothetical protein
MMLERGKRSYPEFPWWDMSAVRRGNVDYLLCVIPIVNEISESEYERHVTSGWLLLGGLAAFAVYVIWDQTRKR